MNEERAKVDYKKAFPDLYKPGKAPGLVDVPSMPFFMVEGLGAPEDAPYQNAVGVLYALTYTIKMSPKNGPAPAGYFEYSVPPLEGLWYGDGAHRAEAGPRSEQPSPTQPEGHPGGARLRAGSEAPAAGGATVGAAGERKTWRWLSLIRQPDFVTAELAEWAMGVAARKKPELDFASVRFSLFHEGLCVQAMHHGPFATEPATVALIQSFIGENGLKEASFTNDENGVTRCHHEIYMGDPRRTAPEKMRTVLRYPVARL